VTAESIEAAKSKDKQPTRTREASPVLRNRRERIEELTLEAQELRAKRELGKLRREEEAEAEERQGEVQAREEQAQQRRAEIALERERLDRDKAEDRRRRQQEQEEEQARFEAEQEIRQFRLRWCNAASQPVATLAALSWLTASQRKEVIEAIEAEIEERDPSDEPRMMDIIAWTLDAALEPLQAERDAQQRRQRLVDEALRSLPYSATDADKVKATAAIREALRRFDRFADVCEMRVAAQEATEPVRRAIERRELQAKLLRWAVWELPWSKTDQDEAHVRRDCAEVLAELPADASEAEAKEALRTTIDEARREIDKRQADKERQARRAQLLQSAAAEVVRYMGELEREGEITRKQYWDGELTEHLQTAVRRDVEPELTGDESMKEIRQLPAAGPAWSDGRNTGLRDVERKQNQHNRHAKPQAKAKYAAKTQACTIRHVRHRPHRQRFCRQAIPCGL
jgi:IgA-specific serine endopeptidase